MSKPKPPVDLWGRMDEAMREVGLRSTDPPEGSFCRADMERNYRMSKGQVLAAMAKMEQAGKIKKIGIWKKHMYFVFVE